MEPETTQPETPIVEETPVEVVETVEESAEEVA